MFISAVFGMGFQIVAECMYVRITVEDKVNKEKRCHLGKDQIKEGGATTE